MQDVTYREIKTTDFDALQSLINQTWQVDTFIHGKKTLDRLLHLYLSACLLGSSFGWVAQKDGSVVGIILGRKKKDRPHLRRLVLLPRMVLNLLLLLCSSKSDRKTIKEYSKVFVVYRDLLAEGKQHFDGELVFLAVSSACRGLGIGKTLVTDLINYFERESVHSIYLYTDTKCNYRFYDSQGFSCLAEKKINLTLNNKVEDLHIFLYCRNIDS